MVKDRMHFACTCTQLARIRDGPSYEELASDLHYLSQSQISTHETIPQY